MQKAYIRCVLPNDFSSICTPAPYTMFKHSMQQSVSSTSTSQECSLAVMTSDGFHLNIGAIKMLFLVLEVEEEVQRMFTAPHRAQFAVGLTCSHNPGTDTAPTTTTPVRHSGMTRGKYVINVYYFNRISYQRRKIIRFLDEE